MDRLRRRSGGETQRDMFAEDGRHPIGRDICTCDLEYGTAGCIIHDPHYHGRGRQEGMITFKGGVWVADLPFAANDELKAAGFKYHGNLTECRRRNCRGCAAAVLKSWWTDSAEVVRKMNGALLDNAAGWALRAHDDTVEASRAGDAELEVPSPPGLEYLPFQRAGIDYIINAPKPRRVLLGDEMGLGKTIQAIGFMNLKEVWTALVVCPANLRVNWQRELERWLTEPRNIHLVDSSDIPPPDAEVVIINYERLIRPAMFKALMSWCWELLICDEAHNLKTPKAKRTIAVLGQRAVRADKEKNRTAQEAKAGLIHRASTFLAITGTALLNRPIEMWTLVHTLDPEGFPDKHAFGIRYCGAHQKRIGWDKYKGTIDDRGKPAGAPILAWEYNGASHLSELQDKLRGRCLVRRLKTAVLPELPLKRREMIVFDTKGAKNVLKRQNKLWMDRGSARFHADVALALGGELTEDDYAEIVARLDAELEIAFEEMSAERKAVAVAKLPRVIEHITNLIENHGIPKLVCFAHHHEVIDGITEAFPGEGITVSIDGRDNSKVRQEAVDSFQDDPGVRLMVAGIRAAGEGITLHAAAHEVFAELDWTPARNIQAEDRCHRIGQVNSVLVQQLVFDGSIDALIAKLLVHKQWIADQVLDHQGESQ